MLSGRQLDDYLERHGLLLGEVEQWKLPFNDEGRTAMATPKRIRMLERELARKEKALALDARRHRDYTPRDPYSSRRWLRSAPGDDAPVRAPRTWLLRIGRRGLVRAHTPRREASISPAL